MLGRSTIPGVDLGVFALRNLPGRMFLGTYGGTRSVTRSESPFQLEADDGSTFFIDGTTGFRHLNSVGPSYAWGPNAELVQNDQFVEVYTLRKIAKGLEILIDYGFCSRYWQSSTQCTYTTRHAHDPPKHHQTRRGR